MKKLIVIFLALIMTMNLTGALAVEQHEWWNILLLGGDSRSRDGYGRTDAMIILSVDREEYRFRLTSVMRDTWVSFPGTSRSDKINAANVYGGPELAVETVNACFGADIEDYILINMTDLIAIIDAIGGVDLTVTESERSYINAYAARYQRETAPYDGQTRLNESGDVHLNGLLAMSFCRNRYTDSDYGRVMRQQKVMLAMARKMQDMDIGELMELAPDILDTIETNLEKDELETLAKAGLLMEIEDAAQYRIPADGTFEAGMCGGAWKIVADFDENAKLLRDFIYGR